jgi:hypothetical protein
MPSTPEIQHSRGPAISSSDFEILDKLQTSPFGHRPYDEVARTTYNKICGGAVADGVMDMRYFRTYGALVDSLAEMGWRKSLSFLFSGNKAAWFQGQFETFLDGGRLCPEETPGYEKFMPAKSLGQGVELQSLPEMSRLSKLRAVAQAMLPIGLFHFDSETNAVVLDQRLLEADLGQKKTRTRLAQGAGFAKFLQDGSESVFASGRGDILIFAENHVLWSPYEQRATYGVIFNKEKDRESKPPETTLLIANRVRASHPLFEQTLEIVHYLDQIARRDPQKDPGTPDKVLSLEGIYSAFGYHYSGSRSVFLVGDLFKQAGANYYSTSTVRSVEIARKGKVKEEDPIYRNLLSNAAEKYYLSAAAFIVARDFMSARSMLSMMSFCLTAMGVSSGDYKDKINRAIEDLARRLPEENSNGPRSGSSTGVDGFDDIGDSKTSSTHSSPTSSYNRQALNSSASTASLTSLKMLFGFYPRYQPARPAMAVR